jgi:hypothetical protein
MGQSNGGEDFKLMAADRCPRCLGPVDVVSPSWLKIEFDLKQMTFDWIEEDHDSDMCLGCALESLDDDEKAKWSGIAVMLQSARDEIYLRPDITLYHHRVQNPIVHRRAGSTFQSDIFFIQFQGRPGKGWRVPMYVFVPDSSSEPFGMIIARQVLSLDGVVPKVVVTWDLKNFFNRKSRFEIIDWEEASQRDLRRLMEGGVHFAKQLSKGRPRGSTRLTQDECLNLY